MIETGLTLLDLTLNQYIINKYILCLYVMQLINYFMIQATGKSVKSGYIDIVRFDLFRAVLTV